MTICDVCRQHAQVRNRVQGPDIIPLVNIPKDTLERLSLDELESIYKFAREGAMVCNDCVALCNLGDCDIADIANRKGYQFRAMEDKRVMEAIEREFQRRIQLSRIRRR